MAYRPARPVASDLPNSVYFLSSLRSLQSRLLQSRFELPAPPPPYVSLLASLFPSSLPLLLHPLLAFPFSHPPGPLVPFAPEGKDSPPPYGLNTFKPLPVSKLHEIASTIAPRIAIYLPAGERLEEIAQLGGGGGKLGGEAEGEGQGEGEGKVTVWQMTFEKRKSEEMKAKALVCFWGSKGK
jgi:hypothetical protein